MPRLLLDFGGVVIKTPFELLHRVGSPAWHGPFDPEADPLWRRMQDGEISERDYWHLRAIELFPNAEDPSREMMSRLFAPPGSEVVRPETRRLITDVGEVAVLTNDLAAFHDEGWVASIGLESVFEPLIDLSFVGYLKPQPEAFAHAVKELGVAPEEVVFVDDQPHNVAGAQAFGLPVVWFDATDPAGSVARIRTAL
jgi:putative hydrolase of the HAD superfamily